MPPKKMRPVSAPPESSWRSCRESQSHWSERAAVVLEAYSRIATSERMRATSEVESDEHALAAAGIGSGPALYVRDVEIVRAIGVNESRSSWRKATGVTKRTGSSAGSVFEWTGLAICSMKKSVALTTEGFCGGIKIGMKPP